MSAQYLLRKLFFIIIILICSPCFAEIAILPYKIQDPSKSFPISTGNEYSRLLFVAANIKKEVPMTSPRDLELDLKRMNINPQEKITEDHIMLIGDQNKIEYVIMGKLYRGGKGYISESILYSTGERKILIRTKNNASDLFKLCELDTLNILDQFNNKDLNTTNSFLDIGILIDTSYSMYYDLKDIKDAIVKLASLVIDSNRVNTQFSIVPFSSGVSSDEAFHLSNSIPGLKKRLSKIMAHGRDSPDNFIKSLRYLLNDAYWRTNSKKLLFIFSNTDLNNARFIERYSVIARKNNITINTFSFGKITNNESNSIIRLSSMSNGNHYNVSYYQKLFDAEGEAVNLYMQNGRIFKSISYHKEWHSGLFQDIEHKNEYAKPKDVFEEIFYDARKIPTTPYNLEKQYMKISMDRIINKKKLRSNIDFLIDSACPSDIINDKSRSMVGRALLTDGKISIWVDIDNPEIMPYFQKKERIGDYFYTGLMVGSNDSSVYGIRTSPILVGLSYDELPEKLIVNLRNLIKKKNYYLNNGLFFPPIWFVKVKVGKLNTFSGIKDLRD